VTVSAELHDLVVGRDGECFLHRLNPSHLCYGKFGLDDPHDARDLVRLTVDHVHLHGGMMGKRPPDDERHLVAMCWFNSYGPSLGENLTWRQVRQAERAYLAELYG
jgi:hypothetical protein